MSRLTSNSVEAPGGNPQYFTPEALLAQHVFTYQPESEAKTPDWPQEFRGTRALDLLQNLQVGLYRNDTGIWLLGAVDEHLHAHERWLYYRTPATRHWRRLHHHQNIAVPSARVDELLEEDLNKLYELRYDDLEQPAGENVWTPELYWQTRPYADNVRRTLAATLTTGRLNPIDLHDLTFHYEAWVARNPGYAALPQEIVWRMQGLQPARARAEHNRAERFNHFRDDDAFLLADESKQSGSRNDD